MRYEKYRDGKYWAVYDSEGELICITVYRKGAREIINRFGDTPCQMHSPKKESADIKELVSQIKDVSSKLHKLKKDLLKESAVRMVF